MVNAVLLRPLPFPNSERLVLPRHAAPQFGPLNDPPMSDALHFLYAEQSCTPDGAAVFSDVAVGSGGLAPLRLVQGAAAAGPLRPAGVAQLEEISINANVLLFGFALSLAGGLLGFGVPAGELNAGAAWRGEPFRWSR